MEKIDSIEPPIVLDDSIDELKEKLDQSRTIHAELIRPYDEFDQEKELFLRQIREIVHLRQDVMKRINSKMNEHETILMKLNDERSQNYELEQRRLALINKISELNKEIQQIQRRSNNFSNKQLKVKKSQQETKLFSCSEFDFFFYKKIPKSKSINVVRSLREIQLELNAVNSFLKKNEDTFVSSLNHFRLSKKYFLSEMKNDDN